MSRNPDTINFTLKGNLRLNLIKLRLGIGAGNNNINLTNHVCWSQTFPSWQP